MGMSRHLPGWLPEWIRKAWHKSRCVCCIHECEWDWVNCGYCLTLEQEAKDNRIDEAGGNTTA